MPALGARVYDGAVSELDESSDGQGGLLDAAPGLLRLATGAWWRTATWTVGASLNATARVAKAATSGESAADLLESVGSSAREQARRLLGVTDIEDRVRGVSDRMMSAGSRAEETAAQLEAAEAEEADLVRADLRDRGAVLLSRSADVRFEQHTHPAYARILDDLSPDEARILRLLAVEGPQASVDVRTGRPLNVGSELIAPGLSMIGAKAGCRDPERVPADLNNLYRLGLVWFSREPVRDNMEYQVLEVQPDVLAAIRAAGRAKTVRRSIHLTPFGADFCATCLPLDPATLARLRETAATGVEPEAASTNGLPA